MKTGWKMRGLAAIGILLLCFGFNHASVSAVGSKNNATGDLQVKGGRYGEDYSYTDHVITILSNTALTISGKTNSDRIVVGEDISATLTLDNLFVRSTKCALEVSSGELTLKLRGENTLKSGMRQPGIAVGKSATLTISGGSKDSLTVHGGSQAAGIGSGNEERCGSIRFASGTVYANGGMKGAGIGGGNGQGYGNLTFDGGRIYAKGGSQGVDVGAASEVEEKGDILIQGNGVLYANRMPADIEFKSGILVSDIHIEIKGNQSLAYPLQVGKKQSLLLPKDCELTIPDNLECSNEGRMYVYGKLQVEGKLRNDGEIIDYSGLLEEDERITGNEVREGDIREISLENGSVTFTKQGYEQRGMEFEISQEEDSKVCHIYGGTTALEAGILIEEGVSVELILEDVSLMASEDEYAITVRENAKAVFRLRGENRFCSEGKPGDSIMTEKNATLEITGSGSLTLEGENGSFLLRGMGSEEEEEGEEESAELEEDANTFLEMESGATLSYETADLDEIGYGDICSIRVKSGENKAEATLERKILEKLADEGAGLEILYADKLEIALDTKAIEELLSETNGEVTIKTSQFAMTGDQFASARQAIGSRPVYDIQIYDQGYKEKRLKTITFEDGRVVVSISYKAGQNENRNNLSMIYVGGNNTVEWLKDSWYDVENEMIVSKVAHFSVYGVAYKQGTSSVSANSR